MRSNVLDLPLKKEWYNMIESGIKTEEYREVKPYWVKRLTVYKDGILPLSARNNFQEAQFKEFNTVVFRYGYTRRTMTYKIKEIVLGHGKPEWGHTTAAAVFIIKLGEKVGETW